MVGVGVVVQSILGTALALFFNLHLRGAAFVRGLLVVPMLLNPVVVGLMWRALLNPDWGIVNWMLGGLGSRAAAGWATRRSPCGCSSSSTCGSGRRSCSSSCSPGSRRCRGDLRGGRGGRCRPVGTLTQITLPLLAPAIVFAAIFRAIDAFRSFDLVFGLTYGGPGRTTTTLSFYGWETGFSFTRYGFASAMAYVMVIVAAVGLVRAAQAVCDLRREDATMTPGGRGGRPRRPVPRPRGHRDLRLRAVRLPAQSVDQAADRHPRGAAEPRLRVGRRSGELRRRAVRAQLPRLHRQLDHRHGLSVAIALVLGDAGRLRVLALPVPRQGSLGVDDPQLPLHAAGRRGHPDPADDAPVSLADTKPG